MRISDVSSDVCSSDLIDALRIVGDGINAIMRRPDKAVLLITHYQRLLDYVQHDFVHVLAAGRIVKSGGPELARELQAHGYAEVAACQDTRPLASNEIGHASRTASVCKYISISEVAETLNIKNNTNTRYIHYLTVF